MILYEFHIPRWLRPALARAVVVTCDEDAAGALIDQVVDGLGLALRAFPAGVRVGLVAGLTAFELGPVALHGRRFSHLDDDAARAWFGAWWSSPVMPIGRFARALKSLIALVYYDAQPIRERLAFHPEAWIAKVARRRLEHYARDVEREEKLVRAPDPLVPSAQLKARRTHA
jgi:hypothetical protein